MGRRGAQASAARGVAGARGTAHGVAFRSDPRGSGEHPRSHIRHRAPVGRGCRRVHRKVRHPCPDILRRNRIRWRRRRLDAGGLPEVLARQARQRWQSQSRRTAAGRRRRRCAAGSRPGRAAGGQTRTARTVRRVDADHRHGAHRRRRIPLDPGPRRSSDHPRRLQGDARRRTRRAGGPSRGARGGGGWPARRPPRRDPGRDGGAAGCCIVDAAALVEFLRARLARYEIPTDIAIVDQIPRTPSGKADLGAVREFFSHPVEHAK